MTIVKKKSYPSWRRTLSGRFQEKERIQAQWRSLAAGQRGKRGDMEDLCIGMAKIQGGAWRGWGASRFHAAIFLGLF